MKENLLNINLSFLKYIFFSVSIFYFIFYLLININEISLKIDIDNSGFLLIIAFILCLNSILFNAIGWKEIIVWFGQSTNINNAISFYILTNSLKYVPGGIWHFVERFNYLKLKSNDELAISISIIEPYFMFSISLFMTSFGVFYNPIYILCLIPFLFLNRSLIYFVLVKLKSIKNKSIKLLKISNSKNKPNMTLNIKSFFPIKILISESFFIISKFLSFVICFHFFNTNTNHNYLFIFIFFCLSWSIGLIVPAAPGGLGVFESCFLFFMGKNYLQSSIIESLIYFRLISTFADLSMSTPFLLKKILLKT